MKERMPSMEVPKKPVDHWGSDVLVMAPPVEVLSQKQKKENERTRKEMVGRLAERVLRLTKRTPFVAAMFAVNGLLSSAQLSKQDIFDPAYGIPEGESSESFEAKREYVVRVLGEERVNQQVPVTSLDRDRVRRSARRQEYQRSRPPEVEGFEEALGMRHETIEQLLAHGYPRGFGGEDAVERLQYTLERIPMPPAYGIHGYEGGHCTVSPGEGASEIVVTADGFSVTTGDSSMQQVNGVFGPLLSHELAHASDWQNAEAVSPEVRLTVLHRVLRRLESGRAIPYPYVRDIRNPDRDVYAERLSKAKEYFAELMADAFRVPAERFASPGDPAEALAVAFAIRHGGEAQTYFLDARLVIEYVRALDPSFDWEKAALSREKMISQLAHERGRFLLERSIRELHAPSLVDVLLDELATPREQALREAPLLALDQEGDEHVDEEDEDLILERLGERERQRFVDLRERLRRVWTDDLADKEKRVPPQVWAAFQPWMRIVRNFHHTHSDQRWSESYQHSSMHQNVTQLNRTLDALRHDPEAIRVFEDCAREYFSLYQGRVFLMPEDGAALRRYVRTLSSGHRTEEAHLASL